MTKLKWERHTAGEDEISRLTRETAEIETSEQAKEAAGLTAAGGFWDVIRAYVDECDAVLAEQGFPPAKGKMVGHDGAGNWWPISSQDDPLPKRFTPGYDFTQKTAPVFSDPWYAAEIGWRCRWALYHVERGASGKPFHYALLFEIASLRKDWQWRRRDKSHILTGRKKHKDLDESRDNANAKKKAAVKVRQAAIQALLTETNRTGGSLEKHLKIQLETKYGISVDERTIRRDLKEIREA